LCAIRCNHGFSAISRVSPGSAASTRAIVFCSASNASSRLPRIEWQYVNLRIARWMTDCGICDACGRPARVTSHQFRHTLGARMINNEVPLETLQRMLDHASPEMTARYATIKDQTFRREWERFTQRVNVRGELIPLEPAGSAMSDAAWALENLSRAKQTPSPTATAGCRSSRPARTPTPA
jgi:Phage integrase family